MNRNKSTVNMSEPWGRAEQLGGSHPQGTVGLLWQALVFCRRRNQGVGLSKCNKLSLSW